MKVKERLRNNSGWKGTEEIWGLHTTYDTRLDPFVLRDIIVMGTETVLWINMSWEHSVLFLELLYQFKMIKKKKKPYFTFCGQGIKSKMPASDKKLNSIWLCTAIPNHHFSIFFYSSLRPQVGKISAPKFRGFVFSTWLNPRAYNRGRLIFDAWKNALDYRLVLYSTERLYFGVFCL